jgi:hypothetical protein
MAITITHTFTNGTIAEAAEVNTNFNDIESYVNGLSDGSNIDSSAITAAKLATNSVTTAKIADGAVTYAKLDSTTVIPTISQDDQIILGAQIFG